MVYRRGVFEQGLYKRDYPMEHDGKESKDCIRRRNVRIDFGIDL